MIYVFKTSVRTKIQAKKLKPHIDQLLVKAKWNFDLDDCDKVLRIDSEENGKTKVSITIYNESLERMERILDGFTQGMKMSLSNLENLLATLSQK